MNRDEFEFWLGQVIEYYRSFATDGRSHDVATRRAIDKVLDGINEEENSWEVETIYGTLPLHQ